MNPAKRKKLHRLELTKETNESVSELTPVVAQIKPTVVEAKLTAEPKKELDLGLKHMPTAEPTIVEAPVEEKLTVQGELVSVLEPVVAPVDTAADTKKKKKV